MRVQFLEESASQREGHNCLFRIYSFLSDRLATGAIIKHVVQVDMMSMDGLDYAKQALLLNNSLLQLWSFILHIQISLYSFIGICGLCIYVYASSYICG